MLKKLPLDFDVENKKVLKKVSSANKNLAELKGLLESLPNKFLLLNTLTLREAKDSSEIENIITTNDELYKADIKIITDSSATKEVRNYREALNVGYKLVTEKELLTTNIIVEIQCVLEENNQGIRRTPGTIIQNTSTGDWVEVNVKITDWVYKVKDEAFLIQIRNNNNLFYYDVENKSITTNKVINYNQTLSIENINLEINIENDSPYLITLLSSNLKYI